MPTVVATGGGLDDMTHTVRVGSDNTSPQVDEMVDCIRWIFPRLFSTVRSLKDVAPAWVDLAVKASFPKMLAGPRTTTMPPADSKC
ncbi:hypothetical protein GQ600_20871 [Phytophthora cactorum]|nr:hypothetical protein GQ600_20871 [Phytophthora cactorum]